MAKSQSLHVCRSCGFQSTKWLGRCPDCQEWGSLDEQPAEKKSPGSASMGGRKRAPAPTISPLSQVSDDERVLRFSSGLDLVDRVLGGGVVSGAAVLLAGEPGIGKSTLLLQMGSALATGGSKVLYVSAEESTQQLRLRAERLGLDGSALWVAGETSLDSVLVGIEENRPNVLLVDSIQAVRSSDHDGPPGSMGQVRHCADRLVDLCKIRRISLFLVGHVTKDGGIAGPKSLEHLVDTVLTFEGEGSSELRIVRAQKNRFGPTGEVAMFEMHDTGLVQVRDPSRVLLSMRREHRPGSAVLASLHGTRPLLVELQALVHPTSFPAPRRMGVGLDSHRITLLVAVLDRFGGLSLADRDLFLNVVGGLTVKEPAVDLALAAAIWSAERERPLPAETAFFGEVGLLGEVRPVSRAQARLREVSQLGFRRVVCPPVDRAQVPKGLEVIEVTELEDLGQRLLSVS